jgi:hypothetical protein
VKNAKVIPQTCAASEDAENNLEETELFNGIAHAWAHRRDEVLLRPKIEPLRSIWSDIETTLD